MERLCPVERMALMSRKTNVGERSDEPSPVGASFAASAAESLVEDSSPASFAVVASAAGTFAAGVSLQAPRPAKGARTMADNADAKETRKRGERIGRDTSAPAVEGTCKTGFSVPVTM